MAYREAHHLFIASDPEFVLRYTSVEDLFEFTFVDKNTHKLVTVELDDVDVVRQLLTALYVWDKNSEAMRKKRGQQRQAEGVSTPG